MALSLKEIRDRLRQQENKQKESSGDGALFPFWNIKEGETATIRFLPDANQENPYFWVERRIIKMPFNGIVGQSDKPITVDVPCMQMYGKICPITQEISDYWNDDSMKEVARTYYRKQSFIYQGFVVNSPLVEEQPPKNPIRRLVINKQLHDIIKNSLMDEEMESLPVDYEDGCDFKINKTAQGQYASYMTSSWARRSRSLSVEELEAIQEFGLNNLKDYLPDEPTSEHLDIIMQMYESSLNGDAYDPARFANYYKPYGLDAIGGSTQQEAKQTKIAVARKTVAPKTDPAVEEDVPVSAADILQKVKKNQSSQSATESTDDTQIETAPAKTAQDILAQLRAKRSQ
jgi:hypothetical protein